MIVVDASVALAWVLPDSEARHRYAANIAAAGTSGAEELVAPRLLAHECSYRLLKFGRSKRWGEVRIAEYGEVIDYFGIRYFDTAGQLAELIRFAMRHNVQGYDARLSGAGHEPGRKACDARRRVEKRRTPRCRRGRLNSTGLRPHRPAGRGSSMH